MSKKLSIDDFDNHPKFYVLQALQEAELKDIELFLRCFQKVAEEGFKKSPDFAIDGIPNLEGNPNSVFFENEEIELSNMECAYKNKKTFLNVRVFCGIYNEDEGTWLEFTDQMAEGIKEILGQKFNKVRAFGD